MNYFMKKWHNFINRQKDSSQVAKIILFSGDKILTLISRMDNFKGHLDLPGGHIHYNEDLAAGLQREVKEETGLTITDFEKVYRDGHITFYWGLLPKQDVVLSQEHSGHNLLSLDEIVNDGYKLSDIFLKAIKEAYKLVQKS